jgi:hypothetical protein
MRRKRERERELRFKREDWRLFIDPATISQKAGCHADDIGRIVLKELVDNGLDLGARVELEREGNSWIISDDGAGLNVKDVQQFFAVERPLLSTKLKRLPLRGMLGNGLRVVMGAVAAFEGSISVETRGRRLILGVDRNTGKTNLLLNEAVEKRSGLIVRLKLSAIKAQDPCHSYLS